MLQQCLWKIVYCATFLSLYSAPHPMPTLGDMVSILLQEVRGACTEAPKYITGQIKSFFKQRIVPAVNTNDLSHKQPEIINFSWGKTEVRDIDGVVKQFKDCILTPTGSYVWDWTKTGTRHVPGIQIADVQDFVNSADVFILTLGVDRVLHVKPETVDYLKSLGKEVVLDATRDAIELYRKLVAENKKVAIVLHSTC